MASNGCHSKPMSQQMEVTASLTGILTGCKRRLICEKHRITLNRCRSRKAQTATKAQLTHLTARVGPAQLIAFWLRVLFCGQGQGAASLGEALLPFACQPTFGWNASVPSKERPSRNKMTAIFNWFTNFRFECAKSILWYGINPG